MQEIFPPPLLVPHECHIVITQIYCRSAASPIRWPYQCLGAFTKFRKATVSSCSSIRRSAWNNSAPAGQILMKFDIWIFFKKFQKIQISLSSDKNKQYFTWRQIHIFYPIHLRMKHFSDKSCRETRSTHIMFNNFSFRKSCRLWEYGKVM